MNSKLKHDASVFVEEAQSRLKGIDGVSVAQLAVELALSGWTPPDPISPRVMAAREWLKAHTPASNAMIDAGGADEEQGARAFLAGFPAPRVHILGLDKLFRLEDFTWGPRITMPEDLAVEDAGR